MTQQAKSRFTVLIDVIDDDMMAAFYNMFDCPNDDVTVTQAMVTMLQETLYDSDEGPQLEGDFTIIKCEDIS